MGTVRVALKLSSSHRFKLPRERGLRRQSDFSAIKESGERKVERCFIANWRQEPELAESRLAVIASKKIGSAVVRNRCKRLLREVFRLNQHRIKTPVSLILIARYSLRGKGFEGVEREFHHFLRSSSLWLS